MAQHSTGYIFGFATAVCLVCSIIVSGAAVSLKPLQEENKLLDKQKKVLIVAGLMREGEELSKEEIGKRFSENIEAKVVDIATGSYADGVDAATFDQRKASADPTLSKEAPENAAKVRRIPNNALVYHVMSDGELSKVILPVEGKGLWSTLYGFVALETDANTISGLTFYEHGETPGLGGEVDNPSWKGLWKGRRVYEIDGEKHVPQIEVIKGAAGGAAEDPFRVDGLSGATLTSRGVTELMRFWMGADGFGPYLNTEFWNGSDPLYASGTKSAGAKAPAKAEKKPKGKKGKRKRKKGKGKRGKGKKGKGKNKSPKPAAKKEGGK
jgi:Na+-transporting NADH:ubiquinone oxidoreductase subunit C